MVNGQKQLSVKNDHVYLITDFDNIELILRQGLV
jgi:hypothetical protein